VIGAKAQELVIRNFGRLQVERGRNPDLVADFIAKDPCHVVVCRRTHAE
jgi:hypothetical protein